MIVGVHFKNDMVLIFFSFQIISHFVLLKCYGQFTFRFPKLFPSVNHSVLKSQWTDIFVLP